MVRPGLFLFDNFWPDLLVKILWEEIAFKDEHLMRHTVHLGGPNGNNRTVEATEVLEGLNESSWGKNDNGPNGFLKFCLGCQRHFLFFERLSLRSFSHSHALLLVESIPMVPQSALYDQHSSCYEFFNFRSGPRVETRKNADFVKFVQNLIELN